MLRHPAIAACLGFTAVPAFSQKWFDSPRLYAETSIGTMRAVADLNGDGLPDVVWATSTQVQAWLNVGNGEIAPGPTSAPGVLLEGPVDPLTSLPRPLLA